MWSQSRGTCQQIFLDTLCRANQQQTKLGVILSPFDSRGLLQNRCSDWRALVRQPGSRKNTGFGTRSLGRAFASDAQDSCRDDRQNRWEKKQAEWCEQEVTWVNLEQKWREERQELLRVQQEVKSQLLLARKLASEGESIDKSSLSIARSPTNMAIHEASGQRKTAQDAELTDERSIPQLSTDDFQPGGLAVKELGKWLQDSDSLVGTADHRRFQDAVLISGGTSESLADQHLLDANTLSPEKLFVTAQQMSLNPRKPPQLSQERVQNSPEIGGIIKGPNLGQDLPDTGMLDNKETSGEGGLESTVLSLMSPEGDSTAENKESLSTIRKLKRLDVHSYVHNALRTQQMRAWLSSREIAE